MSDTPEPDRIDGAPHPRDTAHLIGQDQAQAAFLDAFNQGRLHHAWLLTGPRGVGKATLAWKIARFLLATPPQEDDGLFGAPPAPETLEVSDEHPVTRRMAAGSEPGLFVLRRPLDDKGEKLRQAITVDEVRRLKDFFGLSATDGGRRVVIVDAADELNVSAANALLKVLEEPPKDTFLLLVSHQPSRLLPTIRSRCRTLRLGTLAPSDLETALSALDVSVEPGLATLAGGSVGAAVALQNLGGLELYKNIVSLFGTLPSLDRQAIAKLGEVAAARGAAARYDLLLDLFDLFLSRVAIAGATGHAPEAAANGEASLVTRLAPSPAAGRAWAEVQQDISERARNGKAVNLDPAAMVLDMVLKMEATAAKVARL